MNKFIILKYMKFVRVIGVPKNVYVKDNKHDHVIINLNISENGITEYDIYGNNCEIDINVGSLHYSNEYATIYEQIDNFNYPNGMTESQLNYKINFNLKNHDFTKIHERDLADLIINYAKKSEKILVYGTKYIDYHPNKLGVHDIHMDSLHDNNNHDGAIAFYSSKPNPHLEWLFIKFENQYL